MAIKSTIYKVNLSINDDELNHYQTYKLTIARHPSETDLRLSARLLSFAHQAADGLTFTRGLCVEDEPEIWLKNDRGEVLHWIEMGQPTLKRLRQACAQAARVSLFSYEDNAADKWFSKMSKDLARFDHLYVYRWPEVIIKAIARDLERTMDISIVREGNSLQVAYGEHFHMVEALQVK